ncbi:MAG: hypothetical protein ACRDY3_10990 [Acidimicrobiales bacterium]
MTTEPEGAGSQDHDGGGDAEILRILTGGLVSLRYFRDALRRRRRFWLATALAGLVLGTGYHLVVPVDYAASSTVYLAHPATTSSTTAVQDDLAILGTGAVGHRAIGLLGPEGRGLTPAKLLGKAPGIVASGNVVDITISGPTPEAAVRRVDAVTRAFLSFRAQLYQSQEQALVAASRTTVAQLQHRVATLTSQIAGAHAQPPARVAALEGELAAATTQITSLEQSIQQDQLGVVSVTRGSHTITPGTAVPTSRAKAFVLDGLSGLAIGLALGMGIVAVQAALSDRLRRREDVAAVLGAPVGVSVGRVRRRFGLRRPRDGVLAPRAVPLRILVRYFEDQLDARGPNATVLVVAMDDVRAPAAALTELAGTLRAAGERVVLVDDTADRSLGRSLGHLGSPGPLLQPVRTPGGPSVTLLVPSRPWESGHDRHWLDVADELAGADAVLVMASIDPAVGGWHLRRWSSDAVATVTVGRSTPQRLAAATELLDAAGITVSSAALLGTDAGDESAGLGFPGPVAFERRLDLVRTAAGPPA